MAQGPAGADDRLSHIPGEKLHEVLSQLPGVKEYEAAVTEFIASLRNSFQEVSFKGNHSADFMQAVQDLNPAGYIEWVRFLSEATLHEDPSADIEPIQSKLDKLLAGAWADVGEVAEAALVLYDDGYDIYHSLNAVRSGVGGLVPRSYDQSFGANLLVATKLAPTLGINLLERCEPSLGEYIPLKDNLRVSVNFPGLPESAVQIVSRGGYCALLHLPQRAPRSPELSVPVLRPGESVLVGRALNYLTVFDHSEVFSAPRGLVVNSTMMSRVAYQILIAPGAGDVPRLFIFDRGTRNALDVKVENDLKGPEERFCIESVYFLGYDIPPEAP